MNDVTARAVDALLPRLLELFEHDMAEHPNLDPVKHAVALAESLGQDAATSLSTRARGYAYKWKAGEHVHHPAP